MLPPAYAEATERKNRPNRVIIFLSRFPPTPSNVYLAVNFHTRRINPSLRFTLLQSTNIASTRQFVRNFVILFLLPRPTCEYLMLRMPARSHTPPSHPPPGPCPPRGLYSGMYSRQPGRGSPHLLDQRRGQSQEVFTLIRVDRSLGEQVSYCR